jgi:hypothetical protein
MGWDGMGLRAGGQVQEQRRAKQGNRQRLRPAPSAVPNFIVRLYTFRSFLSSSPLPHHSALIPFPKKQKKKKIQL